MNPQKERLSVRDLYAVLYSDGAAANSLSWARLNNYLVGNSFLIVAWATLYESTSETWAALTS